IEGLEDDCADEGLLALGLDDGGKGVVTSQQFEKYSFGFTAPGLTAVGVTNFGGSAQAQAQSSDHGCWEDQHRRAGINHALDRLAPYLIRRQHTPVHEFQVTVVGNFDLHAESSHAVGSFASHGSAP